MNIITRFAPSPTGFLHVGNVRAALVNWLFTKKNNGKFILRIDDTDIARSKEEYVEQIKKDLKWLGVTWDEEFRQTDRMKRYNEVKEKLVSEGKLYPCFESAEELEIKRKMQLSLGKPPIYDREGLKLSKEKIENFIKEGKKPHYRFKLEDKDINWNDLIRGKMQFSGKNLSDPILIREDGTMTYMLCSMIDDVDYNITHVVRGEDHVSNTAIGIQLTEALSDKLPEFAHLSLLKSQDAKISKREGGFDIGAIKEAYIDPMAVISLLARLGSSSSIEPINDINILIKDFDFHHHGKAPAIYDFEELKRINHKLLIHASFSSVKENLHKLNISITEDFWELIKGNLNSVNEILDWKEICDSHFAPLIEEENKEFLRQAAKLLPEEEVDKNTWNKWTEILKKETGRAGKALFMPIRKALTAKEHGPELKFLLPILGKETIVKRLNG